MYLQTIASAQRLTNITSGKAVEERWHTH